MLTPTLPSTFMTEPLTQDNGQPFLMPTCTTPVRFASAKTVQTSLTPGIVTPVVMPLCGYGVFTPPRVVGSVKTAFKPTRKRGRAL